MQYHLCCEKNLGHWEIMHQRITGQKVISQNKDLLFCGLDALFGFSFVTKNMEPKPSIIIDVYII